MMKFPTFHNIFTPIARVFQRFPLAIIASVTSTVLTLFLVQTQGAESLIEIERLQFWEHVFFPLTLLVPTSVFTVLLSEAKNLSRKTSWIIQGIVLVALVLFNELHQSVYGLSVDFFFTVNVKRLLILAVLLGCAFIPFVFQNAQTGIQRFWQFNKMLFFAAAVTLLWSAVLQAGLSIALFAIDFLFNVEIAFTWSFHIYSIIIGIFAPLFFLNRVPTQPHEFPMETSHPKEVRLFAQFILVPLVTLYFLILYAYTIRILTTFDWPQGELAWMIIGFSFVGVLTYLALYPLRATHTWVRHFGAGLFMAMIPQTGMLFWSLSFRLRDYGITENRYFVLLFGAWLLVCAIYFLVSRSKDIRLIPISLAMLALLSSFGPWSAFAVSERSQVHRLEKILVENELLENGRYVEGAHNISPDDEEEILEILDYLSLSHGLDGIEPWFGGEDLDTLEKNPWELASAVFQKNFNLDINGYSRPVEIWSLKLPYTERVLDTRGYDWAVHWNNIHHLESFNIGSTSRMVLSEDQLALELYQGTARLATIDLTSLVELAVNREDDMATQDEMTIVIENDLVRLHILITEMRGQTDGEEKSIDHLAGILLVTVK